MHDLQTTPNSGVLWYKFNLLHMQACMMITERLTIEFPGNVSEIHPDHMAPFHNI